MRQKPYRVQKNRKTLYTALFLITGLLFAQLPVSSSPNNDSNAEIRQGKRYFLGLLPKGSEVQSCVSCHYLKPADTINWNPAAIEIAKLYKEKTVADLKDVLLDPSGKVMSVKHANIDVPEEEIAALKAFLDDMAVHGISKEKPSLLRLLLFLLLGLVITWALADLFYFKKIKFKPITALIFVAAFGYQLYMLYDEAVALGRSQNYMPDQPIKFSHAVHADQNQIDCMYCHHTADESKSANIPSTQLCMNCHMIVREGTQSGKFEINKLIQYHENGQPIPWTRVHKLPDHVFFSHAQHVGAGKRDCQECHGPVEEMDILYQYNDLSMGWCLECHRNTKVQFKENEYFATFEEIHKEFAEGKRDSVTAADLGANECMKCHY